MHRVVALKSLGGSSKGIFIIVSGATSAFRNEVPDNQKSSMSVFSTAVLVLDHSQYKKSMLQRCSGFEAVSKPHSEVKLNFVFK